MKKLFLITAILCCFSYAKAQDATLKETTDWLTAKLTISIIGNESQGWAQQTISFDGCICMVEIKCWNLHYNQINKFEFNLKDILLTSIIQSHEDGIYRAVPYLIKLKPINNAKVIKHNSAYSTEEGMEVAEEKIKRNNYGDVNWGYIILELDESLTFERISKALKHAIKLCGGTEEKF